MNFNFLCHILYVSFLILRLEYVQKFHLLPYSFQVKFWCESTLCKRAGWQAGWMVDGNEIDRTRELVVASAQSKLVVHFDVAGK